MMRTLFRDIPVPEEELEARPRRGEAIVVSEELTWIGQNGSQSGTTAVPGRDEPSRYLPWPSRLPVR